MFNKILLLLFRRRFTTIVLDVLKPIQEHPVKFEGTRTINSRLSATYAVARTMNQYIMTFYYSLSFVVERPNTSAIPVS